MLNRSQSVRPETRRRVEAAIQSLGYKPQRSGRPHRERHLHVAVVVGIKHCLPTAPSAHPGGNGNGHRNGNGQADPDAPPVQVENVLVRAVRRAIVDQGHHSHSFSGFGSVEQDVVFREAVESGELDGIVLVMQSPEDGYLDWLLDRDVPFVVVNRKPTIDRRFSYVEMDNIGGGALVAEHFLSHGHRRLAVIASDTRYSYNQDRVAGFVAAARRHGAPQPLVEAPADWSQVESTCQKVIAEGATAVFVTSDTLVLDCLRWWDRLGVSVPDQLWVAGFDNSELPAETGQYPTSIGYDIQELGRVAISALDQLCQNRSQLGLVSATIKTRLVERDTTGGR